MRTSYATDGWTALAVAGIAMIAVRTVMLTRSPLLHSATRRLR